MSVSGVGIVARTSVINADALRLTISYDRYAATLRRAGKRYPTIFERCRLVAVGAERQPVPESTPSPE